MVVVSGRFARTRGFDGLLALALKLFPRLRGKVVPALQCVSINRGCDMRTGMTEPLADISQRHAGRQQVRAVGVAQRVKAGALGQLEVAEQQRDGSGDRVGFQGRPVWVTENEIALVALAEMFAVRLLSFPVRLQLLQG